MRCTIEICVQRREGLYEGGDSGIPESGMIKFTFGISGWLAPNKSPIPRHYGGDPACDKAGSE